MDESTAIACDATSGLAIACYGAGTWEEKPEAVTAWETNNPEEQSCPV